MATKKKVVRKKTLPTSQGKKPKAKRKKGKIKKGVQLSLYGMLAIIAIVGFTAMSPGLGNEWADIDDNQMIVQKGPKMKEVPMMPFEYLHMRPHYKPVTYLSWQLEYRLVGDKAFLYHLNNILLHIFNSILVFFISRRLTRQFPSMRGSEKFIALFTGIIFACHPLHVESVVWAVERKDVLYGFFFLLSILTYIRYLDNQRLLPLLSSAAFFLLSAFSKSPGLTVLPTLFLLDMIWKRKFGARMIYDKAAHFAVFFFALYNFGFFTRSSGEGSIESFIGDDAEALAVANSTVNEVPIQYGKLILSSLRTWIWYVHSLLPFRTSIGYPREQIIAFFGKGIHIFPILLALAGAAIVYFRKKAPLVFFAHGFFFTTLILAVIRLGLGIGIFASDRYVYIPVFGLIFWLVAVALTFGDKTRMTQKHRIILLSGVAVLFTFLSFQGASKWRTPETLWTNVIEKYPSVPYAYINRGSYYRKQGQFDIALADANKGVSLDGNANAHVQRGLIYRQMGRPALALEDYNKAIQREPENLQARLNRGNVYLDLGRFNEAVADYIYVINQKFNPRAQVNLSVAYASMGQYTRAEESFAEVERRAPDYQDIYLNRGIMQVERGQYRAAIEDYTRYLRYDPTNHQILNDCGIVSQVINQHQAAVEFFTRAIQLYPDPAYFRARANSYERLGNMQAANSDRARANQ